MNDGKATERLGPLLAERLRREALQTALQGVPVGFGPALSRSWVRDRLGEGPRRRPVFVPDREGWMLVDRHTHRIAKAPDGAWGMYCPQRGPDSLIYTDSWGWVLDALARGTACPHDALLYVGVR